MTLLLACWLLLPPRACPAAPPCCCWMIWTCWCLLLLRGVVEGRSS